MAELSTMIEDLSSNLEDPTKKTSGIYAMLPGWFGKNHKHIINLNGKRNGLSIIFLLVR